MMALETGLERGGPLNLGIFIPLSGSTRPAAHHNRNSPAQPPGSSDMVTATQTWSQNSGPMGMSRSTSRQLKHGYESLDMVTESWPHGNVPFNIPAVQTWLGNSWHSRMAGDGISVTR